MKTAFKVILGFLAASVLMAGTLYFLLCAHNQKMLDEMGENKKVFEQFISNVHSETFCFVLITSGFRSNEDQARLYEQDKRNARPGRSKHNHRKAIDINLITVKGLVRKKDVPSRWKETGVIRIAEDLDLKWGGNFKSYYDPVHFESKRSG